MLIPVSANQVDLWLCFNDDITPPQLQLYRDTLLTSEERARELRFHFERDRKQFVITRALVRTTLSRYAEVLPADWQFVASSHGRPQIVQAAAGHISFNLSHTAGLVVLAVSAQQQLGVDVENLATRAAPLEIANHYFSAPEAKSLFELPAKEQGARFFHYWTLKEAYIKAKSLGLSIPLADFGFQLAQPGRVEIEFYKPIEPDPLNWQFFLLQASEQHVVSVGLQQVMDVQLRLHKIRPLFAEENFNANLLRQTRSGQSI
jgi:4'-phosphopantetheinyl transferase